CPASIPPPAASKPHPVSAHESSHARSPSARKRIGAAPARRLVGTVGPGEGAAALGEERHADHADVRGIARGGGVRFTDVAEADRGPLVHVLAEAVDAVRLPGTEDVAPLLEGSGPTVADVQAVDGGHRLDARAGLVLDLDRVAIAPAPHDVGPPPAPDG